MEREKKFYDFIQIEVRHARTHLDDGKAQFTDYEIELKTNHIAFTIKYSKVRRRYSDFVWLRNRLMKETVTGYFDEETYIWHLSIFCLISYSQAPLQLPGRKLFGRFNKDFIKQRQKKLQDFLLGLVQNNVYLSHTALHLFLQSKFTAEEMDDYLDKNMEEDAVEAILAESEGKARLNGLITRSNINSKHDSGFSGDFDEEQWLAMDENGENGELSNKTVNHETFQDNQESVDDILSDGHVADVESETELAENDDKCMLSDDDNEEVRQNIARMRISSLPAPTPENLTDDVLESSVEIHLSSLSDSDNSDRRSTRSSNKGSISDCKCKQSSQENVILTPTKRSKKRYSRQHSTKRKSLFNSNASLPEFNTQLSDAPIKKTDRLRRSKSFYDAADQKLKRNSQHYDMANNSIECDNRTRYGSSESCHLPRRLRRTPSFLSSIERSPVKRKISLNEYIIVGRFSQSDISGSSCVNECKAAA